MNCTKCGKEIENGSTLCETCGESTTPPKKKLSKKLIAIIAVVVAAVILVVALASGGEDKTSFGITLEEYVNTFNSVVDNRLTNDSGLPEEEYEAVKNKLKTNLDYFTVSEDNDRFYAASNGQLSYMIMLDENDYVQAIQFSFPSNISYEEANIISKMWKWIIETVQPDMGEEYYNELYHDVAENKTAMAEGIALEYTVEGNTEIFSVYYAAV